MVGPFVARVSKAKAIWNIIFMVTITLVGATAMLWFRLHWSPRWLPWALAVGWTGLFGSSLYWSVAVLRGSAILLILADQGILRPQSSDQWIDWALIARIDYLSDEGHESFVARLCETASALRLFSRLKHQAFGLTRIVLSVDLSDRQIDELREAIRTFAPERLTQKLKS